MYDTLRPGTMQDKYGILKEHFGFPSFRPGQEKLIDMIMDSRDVLGIMPTGGGKSLCYQIPALLLDGTGLVISPLISLMKDQVNALEDGGIPAAFINSSLSSQDYYNTLKKAGEKYYKIIYIAPESLFKPDILNLIQSTGVSLLVVDEAHCISHWGHDFRPAYTNIKNFLGMLSSRPRVACFTATATGKVKEDIIRMLGLSDPFVLTTGFDRTNLYFGVEKPENRNTRLTELLKERKGQSGIIYCSTRKAVDELYVTLGKKGFPVTKYHAGLDDTERHGNQDDFLFDRKPVMIATNAFGMGIDKSNVSFVIHYQMPKNIESYYQEAGRAGRDGAPADCILLYSPQDVRINQFLIKQSQGEEPADPRIVEQKLELLKHMTFYAASSDCLRSRILTYFGETVPAYCGNCSNCRGSFEEVDISIDAQKIVSCVYRLLERGRRMGKAMICNILKGSRSEKIQSAYLHELSTYGIMADTDTRRLRKIIDFLIEKGYLAVEGTEYPVVIPTEKSRRFIKEKPVLTMMMHQEKKSKIPETEETDQDSLPQSRVSPLVIDEKLYGKLKKLRTRLASEAKVPAYVIFSDASLRDMASKAPVTAADFLEISGVGLVKQERYGYVFTELIRQYKAHYESLPDRGTYEDFSLQSPADQC